MMVRTLVALAFAAALAAAPPALATEVVDDDGAQCPEAQHTTIQSAVDAATPGEQVLVCNGTYREHVVIGGSQDGIRLVAKTTHRAVISPPLGSTGIGVGYFTIRSDKADRIVGISSPEADSIEIHASVTEGGNVSMQQLDGVDLPAGKTVKFESSGMHLMVFSPRVSGDALTFPITIELQSGATPTTRFRVITGSADHHG